MPSRIASNSRNRSARTTQSRRRSRSRNTATAMTTTRNIRYVHLYRMEHDNTNREQFLFVKHLGAGCQGVVCLVRSLTTGALVARKWSTNQLMIPGETSNQEIRANQAINSAIQQHWRARGSADDVPLVPQFFGGGMYNAHYNARCRDNVSDVTSYWQFCNGGDVLQLVLQYTWGKSALLPAAVIWKYLNDMLRTFDFLMHMQPWPLHHSDFCAQNNFIDWPSDDALVPDFYVGDFGRAYLLSPDLHPGDDRLCSTNEGAWFDDLGMVAINAEILMTFEECTEAQGDLTRAKRLQSLRNCHAYPENLFHTLAQIRQLGQWSRANNGAIVDLSVLRNFVAVEYASALRNLHGDRAFRITADPRHSYKVVNWATRQECIDNAQKAVGPWYVAKVDMDAGTIVDVEEQAQNPHVPGLN